VRQQQKLISIIDYDVCILEYLQPFWRFSDISEIFGDFGDIQRQRMA